MSAAAAPTTTQILGAVGVASGTRVADMTAAQLVELVARAASAVDEPEWLTTRQAMRYTGRSAKTLARWAADGHVEVRRGGGRAGNHYSRTSLDAHLGRSRPEPS